MTSLKNWCVVFDVDETLVQTHEMKSDEFDSQGLYTQFISQPEHVDFRQRLFFLRLNGLNDPRGERPENQMWGVVRPYARELLQFCFSYFKYVVIWSAGMKSYVHDICRHLFRDLPQPHLILTREDCTPYKTVQNELLYRKPLNTVLQRLNDTQMTMDHVLLLDDRDVTFVYDNKFNGVQIPSFDCGVTVDSFKAHDRCLADFVEWLLHPDVQQAKTVAVLNKDPTFIFNSKSIQ